MLSRKTILRALLGVAVFLAAVVAVLLLPAVQKNLLRRSLAAGGATEISLGYFHVTPFGLVGDRIEFTRGPLHVRAEKLAAAVKVAGLWRGRLELTRVSAGAIDASWDLDAPVAAAGGSGEASSGYSVMRSRMRVLGAIPPTFRIDELELAGKVTVLHGVVPFAEGQWTMHGPQLEGSAAIGQDLRARFTAAISPQDRSVQTHVELFTEPSLGSRLPAMQPVLAASGPLSASWDASFRLEGTGIILSGATAALTNGATGAGIRVSMAAPWTMGDPLPASLALLRLDRFPIGWANPWLASSGLHLDPTSVSGSWKIEFAQDVVTLVPVDPLTVAALRINGPRVTANGPWSVQANPRIEVSRTRARISIPSLRLENPEGCRIEVGADAAADWSGARTLILNSLKVSVRGGSVGQIDASPGLPALSLKLLRPLTIDFADPAAALGGAPAGDWLEIAIHDAPLGWISKWLPGRTLEGTLTEGVSRISTKAGGALAVTTTTPWRGAGLRLVEGGRELFHGSLRVSPSGVYGPAEQWVRIDQIAADDARGYRLKGTIGAALRASDSRMGGGIALEAELPHLPGLGPDASPLRVSLSAAAHAFPDGRSDLSHLTLAVTDGQGDKLFGLATDQPISIQRTPESEWLVSSPQPLRLTAGPLSLSWLNPLLAEKNIAIDGEIPATELQLRFTPRHLEIDSKAQLAAAHFHLEHNGRVVIDRAVLRFGASFVLDLEHHLLPVFRFASTAVLHLTDGLVAAEGSKVAQFSGQIGVSATEHSGALDDLTGSLRLDLGALGRMPSLARARLPAQGVMTISLNKARDREHTVRFEGRIDQLVGRNGAAAPALVLSGQARSDLDKRVGGFGVQATLLSSPRPSDLHFGLRVDYAHLSIFDLSSRLEGSYVDLDAVRTFAAAFTPLPAPPSKPGRITPSAPVAPVALKSTPGKSTSKPLNSILVKAGVVPAADNPPWGPIRGHFILDIKKVALKPYVVEKIGGRLDATADSLTLSGLSGEIFDGKCTADVAARFQPVGADGEEKFNAHFHIAQLDAGEAARLRFPNPAAGIDGRVDLDLTLSSQARRWEDLFPNASGTFAMTGNRGSVGVTLPEAGTASTALIAGGTLTFSKELRALGRLVRILEKVPISQLQASGTLNANGRLQLMEMRLESPQLRLVATGNVADAKARDLMGQPMAVHAQLAARGDLAIILEGMDLVDPPTADGYRVMKEPFVVSGNVGQPDFRGLYDLLAKAVDGSGGTWGILMRKVQAEVAKRRKS